MKVKKSMQLMVSGDKQSWLHTSGIHEKNSWAEMTGRSQLLVEMSLWPNMKLVTSYYSILSSESMKFNKQISSMVATCS